MAGDVVQEDPSSTMPSPAVTVGFFTALVAGGMAGTSVDVALFPIDTLKVGVSSFLRALTIRKHLLLVEHTCAVLRQVCSDVISYFSSFKNLGAEQAPMCSKSSSMERSSYTQSMRLRLCPFFRPRLSLLTCFLAILN